MIQQHEADVVVVGLGSSGSVFAGRLAESGQYSLAIIEAGDRQWPKVSTIPAAVFRTLGRSEYDWSFETEPDPTRGNRKDIWPRGKGPGGSSLINGTIFVRGNPADYDAWEMLGATGWSYRSVLPHFRNLERWHEPDQHRGTFGPLPIEVPPYEYELTQTLIDASRAAGFGATDDYNGVSQLGFGRVQANQRKGRRVNPFDAFLVPHLRSRKVRLFTNAEAERLLFDGKRVVGVEIRRNGVLQRVMARRKVVVCSGAIASPTLLMRSGLGPAEELRALGIEPVVDLPEVGRNLREHAGVMMPFRVDRPTVNQHGSRLGMARALLQWFAGKGPAAAATAQAVGFHHIDDPFGRADLQFHFSPFAFGQDEAGRVVLPREPLVLMAPSVNHPESSGRLRLRTRHAGVPPIIEPRFLEAERDVATLIKGVRLIEKLLSTEPFAQHMRGFVDPPPADDGEMEAFVRERAAPLYHPVGTCRMGSDAGAVVDPALNVRGVQGLKVVDTSILPAHVSGNTHAVALMIGEKAASEFAA